MQFNGPLGILVSHRKQFPIDTNRRTQLLENLALQTICERFVRFALAARKLPASLEVDAARPPRDEKPIATAYDSRGDDDVRRDGWPGHASARSLSGLKGYAEQHRCIGHTRHLGLRAVHIVAPKSIKA